MPSCELYCEACETRQAMEVGEGEFAILLATGVARRLCPGCAEERNWRLRPPPRAERARGADSAPQRVLVIDDELATLRLLQRMLEKDGHSVETATSADEAIQKLQLADFDIIISDVMMPGFDGRTLFRFLSVLMPDSAGRIIFVTSDRSLGTRRFFQEYGRPYLYKPIDRRQLVARLREL